MRFGRGAGLNVRVGVSKGVGCCVCYLSIHDVCCSAASISRNDNGCWIDSKQSGGLVPAGRVVSSIFITVGGIGTFSNVHGPLIPVVRMNVSTFRVYNINVFGISVDCLVH